MQMTAIALFIRNYTPTFFSIGITSDTKMIQYFSLLAKLALDYRR